jgi:hypothetical protein
MRLLDTIGDYGLEGEPRYRGNLGSPLTPSFHYSKEGNIYVFILVDNNIKEGVRGNLRFPLEGFKGLRRRRS